MAPIVDTVIVLGRQGPSFRGHRDDSEYQPDAGVYAKESVGNFVEFLQFRVRGGDIHPKKHLENSAKNVTYISKESQNDFIKHAGEAISDRIIEEAKKGGLYSIIADEARDCSNKEQMSLVLRYVDSNLDVREDFISFEHCEYGVTGKNLASVLTKKINSLGLDLENCRGQGYDGVRNVAGPKSGLAAEITCLSSKTLYMHYFNHRLNLSVANTFKITSVHNLMDRIREITEFFNYSQTRKQVLEKYVDLLKSKDFLRKKLQDAGYLEFLALKHF